MRQRLTDWQIRISGIVLSVLLLGAYVPVGYMPAEGAPFQVQLCPAAAGGMDMDMPMGMPMDMAMDMPMTAPMDGTSHPHPGTHDHPPCPFGSAPGAGPTSALVLFTPPAPVSDAVDSLRVARLDRRPPRIHQPRGPPSLT